MKYTASTISRILGLSVETIRNYEKAGIVAPERMEGSGYRQYSYLDFTSLIRTRMYKALDFSMKEITALTNDMTIPEIKEALEGKRTTMLADHEMLSARIKYLDELSARLDGLDENLWKIEICEVPAFYRLEFSKNGQLTTEKNVLEKVQQWMDYSPFVYVSSRYFGEDVYGGISIDEKYAKLFHVEADDLVSYYRRGICLRIRVHEKDNRYSDVKKCTEKILEYADYHRFDISKQMIGHTVIGINKVKNYQRYREIYAPIV